MAHMATRSPLKPLIFAAALLISVGTVSRLAAQDSFASSVTVPDTLTLAVTLRTYTGTATQTTVAGVTTTGTIALSYLTGGLLQAQTTFNGVSTTYVGSLSHASFNGTNRVRSGLLNAFSLLTASGISFGNPTPPIPLIVDKTVAYGGLQNADGSVLTFRALRQTN